MSGAIATLTSATANVPGLSTVTSLISNLLSLGSWRGVPFYMPSGSDEAGQRTVKFLYPGQARAGFRFLGPVDGPIRIEGILIGADCIQQVAKLRAAIQTPGSGKLRHPWYGQFDAVVTENATFNVTEQEIGIVRFSATFERYTPVTPPTPDFFGQLQDAANNLLGAATDLLSDAMDALSGPLAVFSFVSGLFTQLSTIYDGLTSGSSGSAVAAATAPSVQALQAAALPLDGNFAAAASALLAAPALAIADASQPPEQSAVGAGPTVTLSAAPIDPADAATLLLSVASQLAPAPAASAVVAAASLAGQMQAVSQAAAIGATIPFTSTNDAAAWRDQLDTAVQAIETTAATASQTLPLSAGAAWRALETLRQAAIADLNQRCVSLPSLESVTTTSTMDAWKIALALFGDTPDQMTAAVIDLWSRNYLGNPAIVPPGTYQVLP